MERVCVHLLLNPISQPQTLKYHAFVSCKVQPKTPVYARSNFSEIFTCL